jgi:hypothetical protein
MAARRVFVIWTHPIFHESVRLLLSHPDIEFVGATSDYRAAKDEVFSLQPDTILIEQVSSGVRTDVMGILEDSPLSVRVIGLSLAHNELSIYYREQRTIGHSEELIRLIRGDLAGGDQ